MKNRSFPSSLFRSAVTITASLALPFTAHAIDYTWDGGGANSTANTPANWVGDVAPVAGTTNNLFFAGSTRTSPVNSWDAGTGFGNITFNSGAAAFNYSGASRFSINGDIINNSTNLQTISVARAGDMLGIIWTVGTHNINAASGDILISGNMQTGGVGLHTVNKTGAGTVTFSNTGTVGYEWATNVQQGTLRIENVTQLGSTSYNNNYVAGTRGFTVSNGATLAVANTVTEAQVTTMLGTTNFASGSILGFDTGMGPNAGNRAYTANITNTIGLSKLGANTLTLSGTNSYTGNTTISAGELSIASTAALSGWNTAGRFSVAAKAALAVGNSVTDGNVTTMLATGNFASNSLIGFDTTDGNRTYSANLTGARGLAKVGANTLTINGTNSYTGNTRIGGGTLKLGSAPTASAALQMSGTGTLDLNGNNATFTTSASLGSNTAASTNTITDNAAGTGTSVVFFSNLASQDDGTMGALITDGATRKVGVKIANANYWNDLLTNANNTYSGGTTFTAADSYGTRYLIQAYNPTTSNGTLTKSELGTGTIYVGANGTDKASINIDIGNKTFSNDFVWDGLGTNESRGQLVFGGGGSTTFNGTQTLNTDLKMSSFGAGSTNLVINGKVTGNGGLTLSAPASGWGTTVTLQNAAGTNDYAGLTNINRVNEILVLGANNQLPDGTGKGNVNVVGTLRLNGFSDTINGLTGTSTGIVHNNHATTASTLTLGAGDATASFAGNIVNGGAATLAITKNGTGTQTFSGTNSYTGTTTINGGTLQSAKSASLNGTASIAVNNAGSTLAVNYGGVSDYSQAEIATLLAKTTFGATTTAFGFDTTNGSGTYASDLTFAAGLTKLGTNTLTLSGNNSYTGVTTISGGTLGISSDANLNGTSSALVFDGGTLQVTGTGLTSLNVARTTLFNATKAVGFDIVDAGNTFTVTQNLTQTSGGLTKAGNGTLVLSGTNTYTGQTAISGGTLKLGSALTTSGALTMTNAGILDLNGNNATFTNTTNPGSTTSAASIITDNAAGSGTSTLRFVDGALNGTSDGAITDGATRKIAVEISNVQGYTQRLKNSNSTYSGGTVIDDNASGSRFQISSYNPTLVGPTLTKSEFGTGAITIGKTATAKASLYFDTGTAGKTFYNGITFNTPTGLDVNWKGVAFNVAGITLAGTQTANLADATYETFTPAGQSATITGQITGSQGLSVGPVAYVMNLTLANAAGTNDYAGDTKIGQSGIVTLGANDQIADGIGKGNVNVVGTLRMNGFNDTINGLTGTGTVHNNSATTNATLTLGAGNATATFDGVIADGAAATLAIIKTGSGTQTLTNTSTYTGATTVSVGTLLVTGALASNVTVSDGATIGGSGTVGALAFGGNSFFDIFLAIANPLDATGTISFSNTGFGIDNLRSQGSVIDWSTIADGTYTLINGTLASGNLGNFGLTNAYDLGGGRSAYFQEGSLQLVVIPEPRAALLGGLGMLMLLRRRRTA